MDLQNCSFFRGRSGNFSTKHIGPYVCTILLSEGRLCALEQYVRHSTKEAPELRRLRTYELRRKPQRVEKLLNAPLLAPFEGTTPRYCSVWVVF